MKKMNYWTFAGLGKNDYATKEAKRDRLLKKIEKIYDISIQQVRAKDRHREIGDVRNILYYAMHKVYGFSSTETARYLDRNHASILSGSKRVSGFMDIDKNYKQEILELIN